MNDVFLAVALKPIIMLCIGIFILYPTRSLAEQNMKEGKLKRTLLRRIGPK